MADDHHAPHVPTLVVVGLGMILIATLAGVAAWVWTRRRPIAMKRASPRALEATKRVPVAEA